MSENRVPMTFEEFRKVLADVLMTDEARLTPEASFQNDLLVDSIRWLEMALKIETLGITLSAEAMWDIQTVGDSYNLYLKSFGG